MTVLSSGLPAVQQEEVVPATTDWVRGGPLFELSSDVPRGWIMLGHIQSLHLRTLTANWPSCEYKILVSSQRRALCHFNSLLASPHLHDARKPEL